MYFVDSVRSILTAVPPQPTLAPTTPSRDRSYRSQQSSRHIVQFQLLENRSSPLIVQPSRPRSRVASRGATLRPHCRRACSCSCPCLCHTTSLVSRLPAVRRPAISSKYYTMHNAQCAMLNAHCEAPSPIHSRPPTQNREIKSRTIINSRISILRQSLGRPCSAIVHLQYSNTAEAQLAQFARSEYLQSRSRSIR